MVQVIREGEMARSPGGTLKFEGADYGGEVSVFLVNNVPGAGPVLHSHPYSETWIVRSGRGHFVAGSEELDAAPGDIVIVSAETPHKFTNTGTERLDIICIHASPRIIQIDLE